MKTSLKIEAVELLPKGRAKKLDFAEMDLELKEMHNNLSKQIAERSNVLGEEKRRQENIPYMQWRSKIESPLEKLRSDMVAVNQYIYHHATQFSCCTSQAVKLKAKQDALQAYTIIQKIIDDKDYSIDQQNIDLFKIHNNNFRNGVILIVAGVILLAVTMAIVFGGPFILAAITGGAVLAAESTMMIAILITVVTSMLTMIGGSLLIFEGMAKFFENGNDKSFRQSFSNTLPGFFHKDVMTLLPNKDVPAPAPVAEKTDVRPK